MSTRTERSPRVGVLRIAGFRNLWLANLAGGIGYQFGALALSVTAVTTLHASSLQVSVLTALGSAAFLVFGIPSGVWIDGWPKRRVLLVADIARAVAIGSVPVAFALDLLTIVQLMLVAAIVGTASLFFSIAHTSILPEIVARENVSEASARLQTSDTTLRVVGPGLAGQVLGFGSGPLVYGVTAVMHVVSSLLVYRVRVAEPPAQKPVREPFVRALTTGLRFVGGNTVLRTFLISGALINTGAGVYSAVFAVFVLRDLGVSPAAFGLATSIGGVGGIAGSLIGLRVKNLLGSVRAVMVCYSLLAVAFALVPLTVVLPLPRLVPIAASSFCFSLLLVVSSISSTGMNARVTPRALMARVTSARRFVTMGAVPVGALLGGLIATTYGNEATLWLAAALAAVTCVPFLLSPLRSVRELPTEWEASD
ncbi:MFS transporter [Kribbella sp. NPDC048928]|uniref:MFS transporter n=1 Tax=Kribbella sp. NPDC048928 TaxID=3364111 RepID=UPI003723F24E